ncbi:hypothetical protein ACFU5Y_37970 [Streptomyces gardneri]|uniref:hypothetical protein n=1 Tax=Streptomyces gardneri TaxID=66892 RepID=UPI003678CE53
MSRSFRRTGALGAAAVALVTFVAAAPASATAPRVVDLEFTLYAQEVVGEEPGEPEPEGPVADEETGEGVPAPAVGDTFAFAEDLYRTKGGEKAGRDAVTCTVARVGGPGSSGDLTCVGTFALAGGQIAGQVLLPFSAETEQPAPFDIAVTGGTGDFKDVRGQIRSTEDGEYARLDFRLTR